MGMKNSMIFSPAILSLRKKGSGTEKEHKFTPYSYVGFVETINDTSLYVGSFRKACASLHQ